MLVLTDHATSASPSMRGVDSIEASKSDALSAEQLGWLRPSAFGLPGWEFSSASADHLRFYFWLVDVLRPRLVVDLASGKPDDYLAFCQAVERLGYGGKCQGLSDVFNGRHPNSAQSALRDYHDAHFGQFSILKREAGQLIDAITPGTIDVLLLGGRQPWQMSGAKSRAWLDKLSPTGLLVLIDQPEQSLQEWSAVFERGASCVFTGRSPLQVIAARGADDDRLSSLFDGAGAAATFDVVQTVFTRLGVALRDHALLRDTAAFATQLELSLANQSAAVDLLREDKAAIEADTKRSASERDGLAARIAVLEPYVEQFRAEILRLQDYTAKAQHEIERLTTVIGDHDRDMKSRAVLHETEVARLNQLSIRRDHELNAALLAQTVAAEALQQEKAYLVQQHAAERDRFVFEIATLGSRVEELKAEGVRGQQDVQQYRRKTLNIESELNAIKLSTSWRLTAPFRSVLMHSPRGARTMRRALKLAWWTVSLQLASRLALRKRHHQELRRLQGQPEVDGAAIGLPDGMLPIVTDASADSLAVSLFDGIAPTLELDPVRAESDVVYPLPVVADHSDRIQVIERRLHELTSIMDLERQRTDYALLAADGLLDEIQLYDRARALPDYKRAFDEKTPLVSICVATMNRSDLLIDRCLKSLIGQSYENIQIVVVGDHCTDDTASRVARLRDDRIVFRNLPARGPYPPPGVDRWRVAGTNAINAALAACDGQFITHLDDDDSATADRIETLVNAAQKNSADFCWHPFMHERKDGTWFLLGDGRLELGQVTTGSIFYHRYFRRIPWDVFAYRTKEPGDWNRLRKIRSLRPKLHFVERSLLFHYSEGSQPPFLRRDGEAFLD